MAAKVLIVDDHPAICEGLAVRIAAQPDLEVCGQAADIAEAMELVKAALPDVVVVDIQLRTGNGLDLIHRIKAHDDSIQVLVWSMYPDAVYAERALRAGALGYINKQNTTHDIVDAIRAVRDGRVFLSEETATNLLGHVIGAGNRLKTSGVESLSDRELEIFRLIGQGLSTSEIAQRLHRSTHTVEAHRQAIRRKLNAKNASELNRAAAQWVLENGWKSGQD
ncbi:MAG: response regulator transcription factor [Planctomycetes bacterium]|nr:response regulator transcription factor [Planctomycetota bacterium]